MAKTASAVNSRSSCSLMAPVDYLVAPIEVDPRPSLDGVHQRYCGVS